MDPKKRISGIGGIFFKAKNPQALAQWYAKHLGFDVQDWGGAQFFWNRSDNGQRAYSVWSPFSESTEYFNPSDKPYMLNLRVDDLDAVLEALREEGCRVLDRTEEIEQGRFAYVLDPENALIELWQPAKDDPALKSIT